RGVTSALRHLHCIERLGERTDLVELHEQRVACAHLDALCEALRVRDEQVVANELYTAAELDSQRLPPFPVALIKRVLDGDERVTVHKIGVVLDHFGGGSI